MFYESNFVLDQQSILVRILEWVSFSGVILDKPTNEYPKWFQYECAIDDPAAKLNELLSAGYLEIATLEVCLNKLAVPELKAELEKQGISIKGKKSELITRIINESCLEEVSVPKVAVISNVGVETLKKQEEELYVQSLERFNITAAEYHSYKQMHNKERDLLVLDLLEIKQFVLDLDFWTYFDIHKEAARLSRKNNLKSKELDHYIKMAYYHCCNLAGICDFILPIEADISNDIYYCKEYFQPNMLSVIESLPVPITKSIGRYNMEFFTKQIYDIVYNVKE